MNAVKFNAMAGTGGVDVRLLSASRVVGLSLGRYVCIGAGVLAILAGPAFAGPEGAKVSKGSAKIARRGDATTITSTTARTVIDYRSFNLAPNESVNFRQPNAASKVLNRINAAGPSRIDGTITSNGRLYFVNPSGIIIGPSGVINASAIFAGAGTMTSRDFLRGIDRLTNTSGPVVNQGTLRADGGSVALVGASVSNSGSITADKGMVALVSGDDVLIGERFGSVFVRIPGAAKADAAAAAGAPGAQPSVSNTGTVRARGGTVQMVSGDLLGSYIFAGGHVKADKIEVRHDAGGDVRVEGGLDATRRLRGETGGSIDVLGGAVVLDNAELDASGPAGGGSIRIGGDYQGVGDVPTAEYTTLTRGTSIRADATRDGDGGRVIVWSDHTTRYAGEISARGGPEGGDGGFAEVSGKGHLSFTGTADLGAPLGKTGTLLLDPTDVRIVANGGTPDIADDSQFPSPGSPVIDASDPDSNVDGNPNDLSIAVGALLSTNADIIIAATDDIAVETDVVLNLNQSITLTAGDDIFIGRNLAGTALPDGIIVASGTGNITLTTTGATANSDIRINKGLQTDSGTITVNAARNIDTTANLTSTAGAISVTAGSTLDISDVVTANLGVVSLTAGNTLDINSNITANPGGIILTAGVLVDIDAAAQVRSNTAGILIQPASDGSTVGVGNGAAGAFAIGQVSLASLRSDNGTVTIGRAAGTGVVQVRGQLGANADLNYNLEIRGGPIMVMESSVGGGPPQNDGILSMAAGKNLTLRSSGAITVNERVQANGGTITLSGSSLSATFNGDAGDMNEAIDAGAAGTIAVLSTAGTSIGLGAGAAGTFQVSETLLGGLIAGTIQVGSDESGAVQVGGFTVASGVGNFEVRSGESITGVGTVTLPTDAALLLDAGDANGGDTAEPVLGVLVAPAAMATGTSVTIVADGEVTIDSIEAATVSVTAGTSITEATANTTTNITTTGDTTLAAGTTIGSAGATGALDVSVGGVLNASTTNGSIFLRSPGTVVANTLNAGGALNSATLTAAAGDIQIGEASASATVSLNAPAGIVRENGPDDGAVDITASALVVTSQDGFRGPTGGTAIETNVSNLNVTVTGTGPIRVDNTAQSGALAITAASTGGGAIDISTGGNLTAAGVANAGANTTTITAAGTAALSGITGGTGLTSISGGGNVTIASEVFSPGGSISISSTAGSILDAANDAAADVRTSGAGTVTLSAATGIGTGVSNLDLDADAFGDIQTTTGGVFVQLLNSNNSAVSLSNVRATTSGNIAITSPAGSGGTVTFGGDVTTPSGSVTIVLADAGATFSGATNGVAADFGGGVAGTNAVLISVGGALSVQDPVTTDTGAISLFAGNGVGVLETVRIQAGSNGISVDADTDDNGGALTIGANGLFQTAGGNLSLSGADITFSGTGAATVGAGNVLLRPSRDDADIGIGNGTPTFVLTNSDLVAITSTGTVTIGVAAASSSGNVLIGDGTGGLAVIDIDGRAYNLSILGDAFTIDSSQMSLNPTLTAPSGRTLTIDAAGAITRSGGAQDLVIGGGTGTLIFDTIGGSVGTLGQPIRANVANLAASTTGGSNFFLTNSGALAIVSAGGVNGVSAPGGMVGLTATTGDVTRLGGVSVQGSTVSISAPAGSVGTSGTRVQTATNGLTLGALNNIFVDNTATGDATLSANAGTIDVANSNGGSRLDAALTAGTSATLVQSGTLRTLGAWNAPLFDARAGGLFTVNHAITTTGATQSLFRSTDLDINTATGSFSATGPGGLRITRPAGGTIGLGDVSGTDMTISGAELARISSASGVNIAIGDAAMGGGQITGILVDAIEGSHSNNIRGVLELRARAAGANITFEDDGNGTPANGQGSLFNALLAVAANNIVVNENLTTDGVAPDPATLTLTAGNQLLFNGSRTLRSTGDMLLEAGAGGISVPVSLSLEAVDSSITIDSSGGGSAQGLNIAADDGFNVSANLNLGDNTTIDADANDDGNGALAFLGSFTINTANNDLRIIASDLVMIDPMAMPAANGSINAGTGRVTIERSGNSGNPAATTIGVGDATGDMTISKAELQAITGASLTIGGAETTLVTVDNVQTSDLPNVLGLVTFNSTASGGRVLFDNAASIFRSLNVNASSEIHVNTTADIGIATVDGGGMSLNADADTSGAGMLRLTKGVSSDGALSLRGRNLVLERTMGSTGDAEIINSGGNMQIGGAEAAGSQNPAGDFSITRNEFALFDVPNLTLRNENGAGRVMFVRGLTQMETEGVTGTVNLRTSGAGSDIRFVDNTSTFGTLNAQADSGGSILTQQGIAAGTGGVSLAASNTTAINGAITTGSGAISVTGGTVATGAGGVITTTSGPVTLNSVSGTTVGGAINTGSGAVVVDSDSNAAVNALITTASGPVSITPAGALSFGASSVNSGGLLTITSATAASGPLTLNGQGVSLNSAYTSTGPVVFDAAAGFITILGSVNTGNNGLTLRGGNLDLQGTTNSGSATTSLLSDTSDTFSFGGASGGYEVSGAELDRITAAVLRVGGADARTITINGVTEAQSNGIGRAVFEALADGGTVQFTGESSTFRSVEVTADAGIELAANLSATGSGPGGGEILLNADADSTPDAGASDAVVLVGNRSLSADGSLEISAATGGIRLQSTGANSVTLASGQGGTTLNHDVGLASGASVGTLNLTSLGAISVAGINIGGGNLAITADTDGTSVAGAVFAGGAISAGSVGINGGGANGSFALLNGDVTVSSGDLAVANIPGGVRIGGGGTRTLETLVGSVTFGSRVQSQGNTGLVVRSAGAIDGREFAFGNTADLTLITGGQSDLRTNSLTARNLSITSRRVTPLADANLAIAGDAVTLDVPRIDAGARTLSLDGVFSSGRSTTFAGGSIRLGGSVTATGGHDLTFVGPVLLTRDSVVDAGTRVGSRVGDVIFSSTIDSAQGGGSIAGLTVRTAPNTGNRDTTPGLAAFGGSVGASERLKFLAVDQTDSPFGPVAPTIRFGGVDAATGGLQEVPQITAADMEVNVRDVFSMTRGAKALAFGGLAINVSATRAGDPDNVRDGIGDAVLGDITVLDILSVNAQEIFILARQRGLSVEPTTTDVNSLAANDAGVDFVAGGKPGFTRALIFSSPFVLLGGNGVNPGSGNVPTAVGIGTRTSDAIQIPNQASDFRFKSIGGDITPISTFNAPLGIFFDLSIDSTQISIAESIAGAIPRESRQNDVGEDAVISGSLAEDLERLGRIEPRNLSIDQLRAMADGVGLYDDFVGPNPDRFRVTVNRVSRADVISFLRSYDELLGRTLDGKPITGNASATDADRARAAETEAQRKEEFKEQLDAAAERYLVAAGLDEEAEVDPVAFRAYVEANASGTEREVAAFLDGLRNVVGRLESLGLSSAETMAIRNGMLSQFHSDVFFVDPESFRTVVLGPAQSVRSE